MVATRDRVEIDVIDPRKPEVPLPHPGVVLRIDDAFAVVLVAMGTGTARAQRRVCVRAGTRPAFALGLSKDTYFYRSNIQVVPVEKVRPASGRCPPNVFAELLELAEDEP
jgi:hypothetical protein